MPPRSSPSASRAPESSPNLDELAFHPDYDKPLVGREDHIIICTGDDIHFYHSLCLLCDKSSLFKDLLSLPRSDSAAVEILPCDNLSSKGFATVLQTLFDPERVQLTETSDLFVTVHDALKDADAYGFDDFRTALATFIHRLNLYDKAVHFALALAVGLDEFARLLSLKILEHPFRYSYCRPDSCKELLTWCQSQDRWDRMMSLRERHLLVLRYLPSDLAQSQLTFNGFDDFGQKCKPDPATGRRGCPGAKKFQGSFRGMRRSAAKRFMVTLRADLRMLFEGQWDPSTIYEVVKPGIICHRCCTRLSRTFYEAIKADRQLVGNYEGA
jgi:hypothetical protein